MMNKPLLLVVTGRPGSGKTTLAHILAQRIHCPAFCRDEFKEGFVNTVKRSHGALDSSVNREVYETFFQAVEVMVSRGITLVIEAAFQHPLWAPKLKALRKSSRLVIVVCTVDPRLARRRFLKRRRVDPTRKHFHGDGAKDGVEPPMLDYAPPELPVPTLCVDTSDGYHPSVDKIVSFAMKATTRAK